MWALGGGSQSRDHLQLCTGRDGRQEGSAVREGRVSVASAPGVASSPRPLKPGAELLCCVQIHKTGSSVFSCSLNSAVGEGEREVVAAARHGVTGRTADGQGTLEGQLVHRELVGVDQPPVPREHKDGRPVAPALAAGS